MNLIDCHTHTQFSVDSEADINCMIERAIELGLAAYAITDHCECNAWYPYDYYVNNMPDRPDADHFDKSAISHENDFDNVAKKLVKIPGLFLRAAMGVLRFLDYFGMLPKALLKVSPFHGSMVITSMGSRGIPAIYHHLYDFGNLPCFLAYLTV